VKERFLLDRVQLQGADVPVGNKQLAAAVETDTANAIESVGDEAPMPAGEAPKLSVIELLVELSLFCKGLEDIF
jgi:hypothetical protein